MDDKINLKIKSLIAKAVSPLLKRIEVLEARAAELEDLLMLSDQKLNDFESWSDSIDIDNTNNDTEDYSLLQQLIKDEKSLSNPKISPHVSLTVDLSKNKNTKSG